jgi:hypothetical protein
MGKEAVIAQCEEQLGIYVDELRKITNGLRIIDLRRY